LAGDGQPSLKKIRVPSAPALTLNQFASPSSDSIVQQCMPRTLPSFYKVSPASLANEAGPSTPVKTVTRPALNTSNRRPKNQHGTDVEVVVHTPNGTPQHNAQVRQATSPINESHTTPRHPRKLMEILEQRPADWNTKVEDDLEAHMAVIFDEMKANHEREIDRLQKIIHEKDTLIDELRRERNRPAASPIVMSDLPPVSYRSRVRTESDPSSVLLIRSCTEKRTSHKSIASDTNMGDELRGGPRSFTSTEP
jgi:hypothetical protein